MRNVVAPHFPRKIVDQWGTLFYRISECKRFGECCTGSDDKVLHIRSPDSCLLAHRIICPTLCNHQASVRAWGILKMPTAGIVIRLLCISEPREIAQRVCPQFTAQGALFSAAFEHPFFAFGPSTFNPRSPSQRGAINLPEISSPMFVWLTLPSCLTEFPP